MKILYGCCYNGVLLGNEKTIHHIDYVDILKCDNKKNGNFIQEDIMNINLEDYDCIILSPPCNYYSRGNYRREQSKYALETKHLLPDLLDKCLRINKPFIIENVRNKPMFTTMGLYDKSPFVYHLIRHTYFSNVMLDISNIPQDYEYIQRSKRTKEHNSREGGINVERVFNHFIKVVENGKGKIL